MPTDTLVSASPCDALLVIANILSYQPCFDFVVGQGAQVKSWLRICT